MNVIIGLGGGLKAVTREEGAGQLRFEDKRHNTISIILSNYSTQEVHDFLEGASKALTLCDEWNIRRDLEAENLEKKELEIKTNFPNCSCITDCVCQPDEGE